MVYRSTADWYLAALKATFPSSLVFSAIAKLSCGSDAGLGVVGGDMVCRGVGEDAVGGRGVCGSVVFEPDPDAWLAQKSAAIVFFFPSSLSLVPFGIGLHVAVAAAVPVACRFFAGVFDFLFVIKVTRRDQKNKRYNVMLVNFVADDEGKKKKKRTRKRQEGLGYLLQINIYI